MSIEARMQFPTAGFFVGSFAWAVHQQVGYMLVPVSCQTRLIIVPLITLTAALLALAGGWLSWAGPFALARQEAPEPAIRAHRFLASLSVLSALIFLFVIVLQGAASLIIDECQR